MALSQSVASELLGAFRAGEGVDLLRESVRLVLQELIETEAAERIGAERYERTETLITDRSGSAPLSPAGDGMCPKPRDAELPTVSIGLAVCSCASSAQIQTPALPDEVVQTRSPRDGRPKIQSLSGQPSSLSTGHSRTGAHVGERR